MTASVPTQATQRVPELTILMPCLNEAETLGKCIDEAKGFLERSGIVGEIVVADNGSTDGSRQIAIEHGARIVDVPLRGYGAALYRGSAEARGKYVIMGDCDGSYDFRDLSPFLEQLRAGYDLVVGNRFRGGVKPGAMPWKNRWFGNPLLSGIGRLFFKCPIRDFHCGLRGYSAEAFRAMDLRTTGMEFASEMVIKAQLLGIRSSEVPTTLSPDGRSRPPHLRPWRDGWRHLRFMLLYSPRWLFLYPGLGLIVLGVVVGAWVWSGPGWIGGVGFDVHTLLYAAAAVMVGFQAVMFAVLTKIFAISEGLLPRDDRLDRVFQYVNLEVGLVAGASLFLLGALGMAAMIRVWSNNSFGPLDPSQVMRGAIPSVLALTLGAQIILSSFFLSVLGLRVRRMGPP